MWINPNLKAKLTNFHPDTVVVDMDGVLIDNSNIIEFDIVTVRFIFTHIYALTDSDVALLTRAEVAAFKQAGGFNDDFDMIYAITTVYNAARLRSDIHDTNTLRQAVPDLIPIATTQQAGLPGLLASLPKAARPDWTMVQQVCAEIYWGADIVRQKLGLEPKYIVMRGMCEDEQALAGPQLMQELSVMGLDKWGIITGRIALEMGIALRNLPTNLQNPPVQVTGDLIRKPNPAALLRVVSHLGSRAGYYIGDTADDLRLVQYYEALRAGLPNPFVALAREERTIGTLTEDEEDNSPAISRDLPPFLSVMIARSGEEALWQAREADAVISSVNEMPDLLRAMKSEANRSPLRSTM
jgi:HAD superfamily phosphatase